MRLKQLVVVCFMVLITGLSISIFMPAESQAIPSFARTMKTTCATCHSHWPLLNEEGRKFLEQGFGTKESLKIDTMNIPQNLPVSARLNLRIIDKNFSKDKKTALVNADKKLRLRSLHEGEMFVAGKASDFSYFFELEAEDEWPDPDGAAPGFQVQLAMGYAGWHPSPLLNVRAGYTSPFGADGHNTVNQTKPHFYEWAASKKGFIPGVSQVLNVYGTPVDNLFYSLAYHGDDGDLEGEEPGDVSGRVAFDIPGVGASVGGFYTAANTGGDETHYGLDAQWLNGPFQVNAIYAVLDIDAGAKDDVIGILGQYILSEGDSPKAAVAINLDKYTQKDGTEEWTKSALSLTYFMLDNIKVQGGWTGTLSAPDSYDNKESRFTFVVDIGI